MPDERYQTVYARLPGSAAAPTAGLHFTPELWERLRARCEVVEVELRVGLDTFRPVAAETLEEHAMHSEAYRVEPAARAAILARRRERAPRRLHRHDVGARASRRSPIPRRRTRGGRRS